MAGPGLVFAINGGCTLGGPGRGRVAARAPSRVRRLDHRDPVGRPEGRDRLPALSPGDRVARGHLADCHDRGPGRGDAAAGLLGRDLAHRGRPGTACCGWPRASRRCWPRLSLSMFPVARARAPWSMVFAFAGAGAALAGFAAGPPFALALVLLAGASPVPGQLSKSSPARWSSRPFPMRCEAGSAPCGSAGQNGLGLALPPPRRPGLPPPAALGWVVTGLAAVSGGAGVLLALLIARSSPCSSHASAAGARHPHPGRAARKAQPRLALASGAHAALKGTARRLTWRTSETTPAGQLRQPERDSGE